MMKLHQVGKISPTMALVFCAALVVAAEGFRIYWFAAHSSEGQEEPIPRWHPPQDALDLKLAETRGGEVLRYDDGMQVRVFHREKEQAGPVSDVIYLEYEEGNDSTLLDLFLHSPEICLPASGAELIEELPTHEIKLGSGVAPVHHWLFRDPLSNERLHAFKVVWSQDSAWVTQALQERDFARMRLRAAWQGKKFAQARMILAVTRGVQNREEAWGLFRQEILGLLVANDSSGL